MSNTFPPFEKTIVINIEPGGLWTWLTDPALMQLWMFDESMEIGISTNWEVGSQIIISGHVHKMKIRNTGTVLQYNPPKLLQYTHLSSLSRLPDEHASYVKFTFSLHPVHKQTALTLALADFPTESIYRHLVYYWSTALEVLKKKIEAGQ